MPRHILHLLLGWLLHGTSLLLMACAGHAEVLNVTSWGGEYETGQREAFFSPFFHETGHGIVADNWGGDVARIRTMVKRRHYTSTVLDAEGEQVHQGCREGILEEIDYQRPGLSPDALIPGAAHRCGVGFLAWSMIFAYDPARFPGRQPASWADFWDIRTFPGKRGLLLGVETNLEIALLADGVPPDGVYPALRRPEGRQRAFRKLGELRPHVIWWQAGEQAPQLLRDGEVVMTSGWNGRLHRASGPGNRFPLVWNGQLLFFEYWIVPRGHPNRELAYAFIELTMRADRQVAMSHHLPYGPVNPDWVSLVPPAEVVRLPTAPANLAAALQVQTDFWLDHLAELEREFQLWMGQ